MTRYPAICGRKKEKKEKGKIRRKVRKMVLQNFHRWLKVFEKVESERMPVRKPWDHAINLRKILYRRKGGCI